MIDDILQIFKDNNNEWMNYREVFNNLNKKGYAWGKNKNGSIGHKNMVARELSDRHRNKFEIDKKFRPQKYRLKNFNSGESKNEISIDNYLNDEPNNQSLVGENNKDYNKTSKFLLDIENLEFQEYNLPYLGKELKREKKVSVPRKYNYEKIGKKNKIKGRIGEQAVVIFEKNKLISLGRKDLAKKVKWVSEEKGDGLGYDIVSWKVEDEKIEEIYIEVKTTVGDIKTPFYISETEVRVSKKLKNNYYIYRIFDIKEITRKINMYIINGDVEENFDLVPTTYKANLKNIIKF